MSISSEHDMLKLRDLFHLSPIVDQEGDVYPRFLLLVGHVDRSIGCAVLRPREKEATKCELTFNTSRPKEPKLN